MARRFLAVWHVFRFTIWRSGEFFHSTGMPAKFSRYLSRSSVNVHAVSEPRIPAHIPSTSRPPKETRMVRSTIRMLIPLEKQGEALEILGSTIEQTQFEPGCVSSRLYRGLEDECAILLEELWLNDEDVQHHLRSEKYRKILLVVEMAAEPPEIRFDTIAHSRGVETIEQARAQTR
jgi:quinol monooxygenase YgiN